MAEVRQEPCMYYVPDPFTGMPLTTGVRFEAALNYAEMRTMMTDILHYAVKGDPDISNPDLHAMLDRMEFETAISGLLSKLDGGEE